MGNIFDVMGNYDPFNANMNAYKQMMEQQYYAGRGLQQTQCKDPEPEKPAHPPNSMFNDSLLLLEY